MNPRYVGFEGVEGAGKSTVVREVAAWLEAEGEEAVVVREPGGTPIGEEIRRLLLHADAMTAWTEAALFAAARAELVAHVVTPALARGAFVLSDRTYYSSLAYQGVGRGLGVEAVRAINEQVLGGVVPEMIVVLDVDPEVGFARETERDRIGSEGVEFQRRIAGAYRELAAVDHKVRVVAGANPSEVVVADVLALLGMGGT